jgi:hypothetical protein
MRTADLRCDCCPGQEFGRQVGVTVPLSGLSRCYRFVADYTTESPRAYL